jgi:hypothetical protein
LDAKKIYTDLKKIPVIGDLILSFALVVVLITLSSAGGFWGLETSDKEILINVFIGLGVVYFSYSILKRVYIFFKNK